MHNIYDLYTDGINKEDIVDRVYFHSTHSNSSKFGSESDAVTVKEKLILKDGSVIDNLRVFVDYERPFWITKPEFRNHKQKKERELISKLTEFRSNERMLVENIKRALGNFYLGNTIRDVCNNPYIYGTDVPIESLIKKDYEVSRKTDRSFSFSYGTYDIETYTADETYKDQPIMATTVTNKVIQTTVHSHFVRQFGDRAIPLIQNKFNELLGHIVKDMNLDLQIEIVPDPGQVAKRSIEKIHETDVDIIGIWNMDFDIPRVIDTLVYYGHSVEDVFSDPRIPREFTKFEYTRGPTIKKTEAGKMTPISPHERWNIASFPAKWTVLDAMCVYYRLRRVGGNESGGYGLDAVLTRNINMGKLKFTEADKYIKLAWHNFMQTNYPIEYIIYNIFDSLGMLLLENKTKDIQVNFPLLCSYTPFRTSSSNPKKFCDELHFDLLDNKDDEGQSVLGSTGRQMTTEEDEKVVDRRGWVMTLQASMMERKGVNPITDIPGLKSNFYIHVSDLDLEGTYPNEQVAFNLSKETTRYEVLSIEGVDWENRRRYGVQLNAGEANAGSLCPAFFKLPTYPDLLDMFNKSLEK